MDDKNNALISPPSASSYASDKSRFIFATSSVASISWKNSTKNDGFSRSMSTVSNGSNVKTDVVDHFIDENVHTKQSDGQAIDHQAIAAFDCTNAKVNIISGSGDDDVNNKCNGYVSAASASASTADDNFLITVDHFSTTTTTTTKTGMKKNASTPGLIVRDFKPAPKTIRLQGASDDIILAPATDVASKGNSKAKRFHRLFRSVPVTEVLLNRFSCAFVSDIGLLIQGHMYVSKDWICFHSNIFGIEKIIEIPVYAVALVCKSKTAKIIPNAVCIRTVQGRRYQFGSLISRDSTYQALSSVLNRARCLASPDPTGASNGLSPKPFNQMSVTNMDVVSSIKGASIRPSTTTGLANSSSESSEEDSILDTNEEMFSKVKLRIRSASNSNENGSLLPRHSPHLLTKDVDVTSDLDSLARFKVTCSTAWLSVVKWILSLPKIIVLLLICVFILILLLSLSAILMHRLMYFQSSPPSLLDLISDVEISDYVSQTENKTYQHFSLAIDEILQLLQEIKDKLDILKNDFSI